MDKKDEILKEEVKVSDSKIDDVTENKAETKTEETVIDKKNDEKAEKILNFGKGKAKKESKSHGELEKAKKEIDELKATVQRTQADFINFKRRTEKEKEDLTLFANEKIIIEILGVVDNFERAINTFEDKESPMFSGVEMIAKQMTDLLKKYGVEEISTDDGFDPNVHHAVMQESGDESEKILEVFQKGYKIKDKVIRPAMVKVSI